MNKNFVLVSLVAILSIVIVASSVSAASSLDISVKGVWANNLRVSGDNVAVIAGQRVPVVMTFTANENASDVQVSAWFQGHRSETFVESDFQDLIKDSDYRVKEVLKVPTDIDPEEDLTLFLRIESDEGNYEEEITLKGQRESDNLEVVLFDLDQTAKAGQTISVSVVLKNMGRQEAEDTLVTVSIPELGISRSAYFEDLYPVDECDNNDDNCDKSDSRERRIFLTIPENALLGDYKVTVKAFNDDTNVVVSKQLTISSAKVSGQIIPSPASQSFAVGQEVAYDVVLVNSGEKIAVYTIVPTSSDALSIRVSEPATVVPAGSSKVVRIYVTANREGTFPFGVKVTSDNFSETVQYTATVEGKSLTGTASNNIVALTIVLAIIFIVLVIVLVVLLTRRPERTEEFGESYY